MKTLRQYTVQVLTSWDSFHNKPIRGWDEHSNRSRERWVTKEYRQVTATSAEHAMRLTYCGPFCAIGSVHAH